MNTEQIDKIAKAYAIEYYNVRGGVELMTDEARNMIEFILRDYLIVEKIKVEGVYDAACIERNSDNLQAAQNAMETIFTLKYLFPETFNQEKQ